MSTFPNKADLNGTPNEGVFKAAIGAFLDRAKELPGGTAQSELTISAGQVTPTGPAHSIDTAGDASTDDLDNLLLTNTPAGSVIFIRAENAARTVVVKHAAGGSGQISTVDGDDIILDDIKVWVGLLLVGTTWEEIFRSKQAESDPWIIIEDQKAQNTQAGTATSGSFQTRNLNTEVHDGPGVASITSNQFTLQAGTYSISWSAPAHACNRHQTRLRNITDTVNYDGTSSFIGNGAMSRSEGSVVLTLAAAKTFEVQHQVETTQSTNGFGVASNFATEVYTRVVIYKLG